MRILQIANDFSRTKVHSNMFRNLDELGVHQVVFNAVKGKDFIGRNAFEAENTEFVYANVVKPYHKYIYHVKIRHVYKEMMKRIDADNIDLCHASTLFTDGGLAYKLYKQYGIPYFVAVRNTDVNGFMNKLPHTWSYGRKILLNADRVFFISDALRRKFEGHSMVRDILPIIKDKFVLMPNGIDDFFLDNVDRTPRKGSKVVYVGNFTANKNVIRLVHAVLLLRTEPQFKELTLTLVGGGKEPDNELPDLIKNNPGIINFIGPVYDKESLCKIYRDSRLFAMVSIFETFGLVYIEALSQNLPVLYTKGQGIDGLFGDGIGVAVNPLSVDEIAEGLRSILTNRSLSNSSINFGTFRWKHIAEKYKEYYQAAL